MGRSKWRLTCTAPSRTLPTPHTPRAQLLTPHDFAARTHPMPTRSGRKRKSPTGRGTCLPRPGAKQTRKPTATGKPPPAVPNHVRDHQARPKPRPATTLRPWMREPRRTDVNWPACPSPACLRSSSRRVAGLGVGPAAQVQCRHGCPTSWRASTHGMVTD